MADVTTTFGAKDVGVAATISRLTQRLAGFQASMSKVSAVAEKTQSSFSGLAKAAIGLTAAYIGISQAMGAFNAAVNLGGELDDLTKRTGMAAGDIMVLRKAFKLGGASAESVGPTIDRLRRSIVAAGSATGAQAEAFAELGLNIDELRTLSPTEQLRRTASAIMSIGDDARRTALAVAIFGKSGGELIPLFSNFSGELDKAQGYLGSTPAMMTEMAASLADLSDDLSTISEKGRDFMVGVLSKLAPSLLRITGIISKIDAGALGAVIGGYITKFGEFLTKTFEVEAGLERIKLAIEGMGKGNVGEGLELLFKSMRNAGLNALNEIFAAAQAGISTIWQTLTSLFRANGPTIMLLNQLFGFISNRIKQIVNEAVAELPRMFGGGPGRMEAAQNYGQAADQYLSNAGMAAGMAGQDIIAEADKFTKRFSENMASASRPFDMSAREAEVKAITDKMIAPTLDSARKLLEQLQSLMAREPASPERREQEAELIRALHELRTNGISSEAINRLSEEMSRNAMPQSSREEMARQASAVPTIPGEEVASETTLQRVATLMESLNTKLPQPVLV